MSDRDRIKRRITEQIVRIVSEFTKRLFPSVPAANTRVIVRHDERLRNIRRYAPSSIDTSRRFVLFTRARPSRLRNPIAGRNENRCYYYHQCRNVPFQVRGVTATGDVAGR